jgi:hypothetical protein
MSKSAHDGKKSPGRCAGAADLDRELARILAAIERETTPENLLRLAEELQIALLEKKNRD